MSTDEVLWLFVVGLLWGCTNPFMKLGSRGINRVHSQANSKLPKLVRELQFLFTQWKYVVPLVINLFGSFVFYQSLGKSDLSLVVPICNSLTFIFTTLTAQFILGESAPNTYTYFGMALVVLGVGTCISSKQTLN